MSTEETPQQRQRKGRKGRSLQRQRALDVLYEADLRHEEIGLAELLEIRSNYLQHNSRLKSTGSRSFVPIVNGLMMLIR